MNKLFIIGNGFDLAHGLQTKYSDFLLWYINKTMKSLLESRKNVFEDDLVRIENGGAKIKVFDSLESFKDHFSKRNNSIQFKYDFFKNILNHSNNSNWVDIEYEYYFELLRMYRTVAKNNIGRYDGAEREIRDINDCLELLKLELKEYLQSIKTETYNSQILSRFKTELEKTSFNDVMFLIFNYTNTIDLYLNSLNMNSYKVIYIHGQLSNPENPIIFGYGDEMDEYYSKIESLNLNEFLKNMKSFSYFKTNNYQALNHFLNKSAFTVSIMGHSCGLSDRVLLSSIFSNKNCVRIRIYYYLKAMNQNDYFEKTQEISRHFPLTDKNRMRNLIVPLPDSTSLS